MNSNRILAALFLSGFMGSIFISVIAIFIAGLDIISMNDRAFKAYTLCKNPCAEVIPRNMPSSQTLIEVSYHIQSTLDN